MSVLRVLLAWLIMAAIPLQGLAAVSMAFCQGTHQHTAKAQGDLEPTLGTNGHDHSAHQHAADAPKVELTAANAASAKDLPDASHKCGVCASCCHSLAIAELPHWPAVDSVPQAASADVFVLIHAVPSELPDKPPRG